MKGRNREADYGKWESEEKKELGWMLIIIFFVVKLSFSANFNIELLFDCIPK
jgi:hypothetical protein